MNRKRKITHKRRHRARMIWQTYINEPITLQIYNGSEPRQTFVIQRRSALDLIANSNISLAARTRLAVHFVGHPYYRSLFRQSQKLDELAELLNAEINKPAGKPQPSGIIGWFKSMIRRIAA